MFDKTGHLLQQWQVPACSSTYDTPRMCPAVGNLDGQPGSGDRGCFGLRTVAAFKLSSLRTDLDSRYYGTFVGSPVIGDLDAMGPTRW